MNIMVISDTVGNSARLITELNELGYNITNHIIKNGLLAEVNRLEPRLLIFHMHAPSSQLLETINIICFVKPLPVIVFVDTPGLLSANEVIKSGVTSYIVDGLAPGRLCSIIDIAMARFAEYQSISQELLKTKEKLEDRKWIDKAKGILMQVKRMSEDDAYAVMRQMAMENNKRMVDIAKNIISVHQLALK